MKPLIPFLALTFGLTGPALAQDAAQPLSAIIAAVEAQGYRVTDVDTDHNAVEVNAVKAQGQRVDLRVDPSTGAILSETRDD